MYDFVNVVDRVIQLRLSPFPSTPLGHSWLLVPSTTPCQCGISTLASKLASYLLWCSYILYKLFFEIWLKVLHFVLHLHSFKFLKCWKLCKKKKKKYWLRWYKLNVFKKNHILVYIYGLWKIYKDKIYKDIHDDFLFRRIHSLIGHKAEISSAQFNWDCSLIATGSMDKTCKIWDPPSGKSKIWL